MSERLSVVLATRNAGKAGEFERLLGGAVAVRALTASVALPQETGSTFAENARLKARMVFSALAEGTAVLADDSGLEVSALDGRPGILSARFARDEATDEANVDKLLRMMSQRDDREARFVCSLCLVLPGGVLAGGEVEQDDHVPTVPCMIEVEGVSLGTIARAPRGDLGFGYDPVFQPTGWSVTLAEATPEEKDRISHRGAAARALLARLEELRLVGRGS